VAGRLSIGSAMLSAIGGALFVVAGVVWALTLTGTDASAAGFLIGFALTGVAAGIAQTGFLSSGAGALRAGDYAAGTGVINTARQIGAALGVALLTLYVGSGHDAADYGPVWFSIIAAGAVAAVTILPAWLRARRRPEEPAASPGALTDHQPSNERRSESNAALQNPGCSRALNPPVSRSDLAM
jgi:hypothetical protein